MQNRALEKIFVSPERIAFRTGQKFFILNDRMGQAEAKSYLSLANFICFFSYKIYLLKLSIYANAKEK